MGNGHMLERRTVVFVKSGPDLNQHPLVPGWVCQGLSSSLIRSDSLARIFGMNQPATTKHHSGQQCL